MVPVVTEESAVGADSFTIINAYDFKLALMELAELFFLEGLRLVLYGLTLMVVLRLSLWLMRFLCLHLHPCLGLGLLSQSE